MVLARGVDFIEGEFGAIGRYALNNTTLILGIAIF
jgi:hypothetical protein